jgi:ribonuclease HI
LADAAQAVGDLTYHLETDASLDPRRTERNTDGRLLSFAGAGIVVRDPTLALLDARSIALGFVPSPTHAEYGALLAGLKVVREHRIGHLRIRNDNLSLVRHLTGETEGIAEDLHMTMKEIGELRSEFLTFDLRWAPSTHIVRRKDNAFSADYLARMAGGLWPREVRRGSSR